MFGVRRFFKVMVIKILRFVRRKEFAGAIK
jgi:hypothetical protein